MREDFAGSDSFDLERVAPDGVLSSNVGEEEEAVPASS